MQPKLIKSTQFEYAPAPFSENKSGWHPSLDRVLVRPDIAVARSSGGVDLPEELTERMQMAAVTGVIVAIGDDAFRWNSDGTRPFEGYKPKPGDRVIYQKYSGEELRGEDGIRYRVMDYKNIGGIKRQETTQ